MLEHQDLVYSLTHVMAAKVIYLYAMFLVKFLALYFLISVFMNWACM